MSMRKSSAIMRCGKLALANLWRSRQRRAIRDTCCGYLGDRTIRGEMLRLFAGQTVCAASGRCRVEVPANGLEVAVDRVTFRTSILCPKKR